MLLDEFLNEFFSNLTDKEGIENICKTIRENISVNYDTTKIEFQVSTEENDYAPDVSINSEGYDDGEVVFIDCYID